MLRKLLILVYISACLLFYSCKENSVENEPTKSGSSQLDVNIISTSYVLNTIAAEHLDTNYVSSYYYRTINMKIKLDKPENRNQINKLVIYGKDGLGWEFFNSDLNTLYVDSVGGFVINNLIYASSSQYYSDIFFTIKLFAKDNSTNNQYECVIKNSFFAFTETTNDWLNQNRLRISFSRYYENLTLPKTGKMYFLDDKYNKVETSTFYISNSYNSSSGSYYYNALFDNVPDNAQFFYMEFNEKYNFIERNLKTRITKIADRLPDNLFSFDTQFYFENGLYISQKNKIILWSNNSTYDIHIIDENTLKVEKTLRFSNYVRQVKYCSFDEKVYLSCSGDGIYSIDLDKLTSKFVTSNTNYYPGMDIAGKYIIYSQNSDRFSLYNIENKSIWEINDYWNVGSYYMVFNDYLNQLYCSRDYYLESFTIDLENKTAKNRQSLNQSSSVGELVLFPDRSKIISLTGDIFECSSSSTNLTKLYDLSKSFRCVSFSEDNNLLVGLEYNNSNNYKNLLLYSLTDFEQVASLTSFYGRPLFAYCKNDKVRILSTTSSNINILEEYTFNEIISNQKNKGYIPGEIFYFPVKIN